MENKMSDSIKILALSDIFWREARIYRRLIALVAITKPNLVLLAGDLVNDRPVSDFLHENKPYLSLWKEVSKFLDFLESSKIQCYIVRGNWDQGKEYDDLMQRKYTYIQEISNKIVEFRGIKIWGIPHNVTTKKSTMPKITNPQTEQVDIILTHADGPRRMLLFEYPTKLIITGHSDQKFCLVRDKVFFSFSSFPDQYAVIDYSPSFITGKYFYKLLFRRESKLYSKMVEYKARFIKGMPYWATEEAREFSFQYTLQMEGLLSLKEQAGLLNTDEKREAINQLLSIGVSKAQIEEHILGASKILKPSKTKKTPPE